MTTRRCAKSECSNKQPCPIPGHNTKQWGNVQYYQRIPEKDKKEVRKQANGLCRKCGRPGSEVDHIINVAAGGKNEFSNYQLLCHSCHKEKTRKEIKYGQSRRNSI